MKRAVFLDRDGVLNRLVFNPATQAYESPHNITDFDLYPGVVDSLLRFQERGYLLFLVSNQPSFAKGKTSLENIKAIHKVFNQMMIQAGVTFTEYYYCFHHPNGVVPELTCICPCRKPEPFFPLKAKEEYLLDMPASWFIGDQDSDVCCGQRAGVRTVLITELHSSGKRGKSHPDYYAQDLQEAKRIVETVTEQEG